MGGRTRNTAMWPRACTASGVREMIYGKIGVPALRLSHPTIGAGLRFSVGCDQRANASAGTPMGGRTRNTAMWPRACTASGLREMIYGKIGVPALRLSHPTIGAGLRFSVGCDQRANASAGTPMGGRTRNTAMWRVACADAAHLHGPRPASNNARENWCACASLVTPYEKRAGGSGTCRIIDAILCRAERTSSPV